MTRPARRFDTTRCRWNAGNTLEKGFAVSDNTPHPSPGVPPVPPAQPAPGYSAPAAPYGAPVPPSYPQQPGQAAPYGYGAAPYPYAAAPRTNGLAITSLIASIANFFVLPLIGAVVGVITGHIALKQLRTSGEGGRGMALAGTIVGWVGVGLCLIFIAFIVVWLILVFGAVGYSSYTYSS